MNFIELLCIAWIFYFSIYYRLSKNLFLKLKTKFEIQKLSSFLVQSVCNREINVLKLRINFICFCIFTFLSNSNSIWYMI